MWEKERQADNVLTLPAFPDLMASTYMQQADHAAATRSLLVSVGQSRAMWPIWLQL